MATGTEKEPRSRKNLLTITLVVIVLLMAGYAVFGERGMLEIQQAQRRQRQLQQQLAELQTQQEELREEIERLRKDKDYWEYLARTRLGMVRDGELIYHLPDQDNENSEVSKE